MTRYLLDRDVMSQLDQPENNRRENVKAWFDSVDDNALFVGAITVMETWKGLAAERKRAGSESRKLDECERNETAFEKLLESFLGRIEPIDEPIAKLWGKMIATREKHVFDAGTAATAITLGLIVFTRNTKDFSGLGATLLNPFKTNPVVEEPSP